MKPSEARQFGSPGARLKLRNVIVVKPHKKCSVANENLTCDMRVAYESINYMYSHIKVDKYY